MTARWRYILQEAVNGLRRNLMMTVAVVLSVTVSLTLLGSALLLSDQVNLATDDWVGRVEVSIFLCDGRTCPAITPEQQETLLTDLEEQPVVQEVFYESKRDAYERFVELFREQPTLVDSVDPDVLPASFRVKLADPQLFRVIADQFEAYPGVEEIVDQRRVLDQFLRFTNIVRGSALVVAAIQLIAAYGWRTAMRMLLENPVNGVGARGFRYAYADHSAPEDMHVEPGSTAIGAAHPHQLLLELASETGLLGLAGWLVAMVLLFRLWHRAEAQLPLAKDRDRFMIRERLHLDA